MPPEAAGAEPVRRLRPALGTLVRIEARAPIEAIEAAYRAIERVEASMSFHRSESELRSLMRAPAGHTLAVSSDLYRVLEFARRVWEVSGGVFDPTIAPALVALGLLPRPDGCAPESTAGLADLELHAPNHVRLHRPLWIDLGGIAKGYAVDEALRVLRERGAQAASVNAGGDFACFGPALRIALRDPGSPHAPGLAVELRDAALASSGAYFRPGALRGRLGRRTMRRSGSVTVLAGDCMTADALTKVVWAAPAMAPRVLDAFNARALSLDARARPRWLNAA